VRPSTFLSAGVKINCHTNEPGGTPFREAVQKDNAPDDEGGRVPLGDPRPGRSNVSDMPGVVIVGGGPAGLTCATTLARAGVRVAVIDREGLGGRLVNADQVYDIPDVASGTSGAEAAGRLAEAVVEAGVRVEFAEVETIARAKSESMWTVAFGSESITAGTVVMASGSRPTPLSVPGADRLEGRGISYCPACDGPLFKGKDVVVLLGDEWGADETVQVARSVRSVRALIHPDADPRLERHLDRLADLPGVSVERDVVLRAVLGDSVVSGISVAVRGEAQTMATEGIFSSLRTTPNAELVADAVRLDKAGAIMVDEPFRTSAAGLFAIGEARGGNAGTAAEAIADGRALALQLTRGLPSAAGSVQVG